MFLLTEIKYQLLRNKSRSALTVCIAALLVGCMAFYLGNINSNEVALNQLNESVPVKVWVVNRSGSRRTNLSIDEAHFDALMRAGVHDALYQSCAAGAMERSVRSGDPFLGGDTDITGANDLKAVEGLKEEAITFLDDWDSSFFTGNEAVCAVNENYAENHGLKLGDEVTLPVYGIRYGSLGPAYEAIGDVTLQVIGIYGESDSGGVRLPSVCVPVQWLKEVSEKSGVTFFYASLCAVLDNPLDLNAFKSGLEKAGFMQVFADAADTITGDALSVEDELFIKTADELLKNLAVYRGFLIPFFVLVVGLVSLVTFLMLRNSRRDMAIACSLGRSKGQSAVVYFFGTILAELLGCLAALPILSAVAGIEFGTLFLILGVFLLCAGIGTALSLAFLLRFDPLILLTKID